jgi:hypothetical protein
MTLPTSSIRKRSWSPESSCGACFSLRSVVCYVPLLDGMKLRKLKHAPRGAAREMSGRSPIRCDHAAKSNEAPSLENFLLFNALS